MYIGGGLDSNHMGFSGSVNSGWFLIMLLYKINVSLRVTLTCTNFGSLIGIATLELLRNFRVAM